jgi:hypothetical protein
MSVVSTAASDQRRVDLAPHADTTCECVVPCSAGSSFSSDRGTPLSAVRTCCRRNAYAGGRKCHVLVAYDSSRLPLEILVVLHQHLTIALVTAPGAMLFETEIKISKL